MKRIKRVVAVLLVLSALVICINPISTYAVSNEYENDTGKEKFILTLGETQHIKVNLWRNNDFPYFYCVLPEQKINSNYKIVISNVATSGHTQMTDYWAQHDNFVEEEFENSANYNEGLSYYVTRGTHFIDEENEWAEYKDSVLVSKTSIESECTEIDVYNSGKKGVTINFTGWGFSNLGACVEYVEFDIKIDSYADSSHVETDYKVMAQEQDYEQKTVVVRYNSNAENVRIYRKKKGGSWKLIKTVHHNINNSSGNASNTEYRYKDKNLSPTSEYYYRISTRYDNSDVWSEPSKAVKYITAPATPTGVKRNGKKAFWNKVKGADGYYIYYWYNKYYYSILGFKYKECVMGFMKVPKGSTTSVTLKVPKGCTIANKKIEVLSYIDCGKYNVASNECRYN